MSGLKTGVEDFISWSETGSGFREPGGTRYQESPGVPPPPGGLHVSDSFYLSTLSYFIKNIDSPL